MKAEQCLEKDCSRYITDKPMTSIGLAMVGGFLLSRVLSAGKLSLIKAVDKCSFSGKTL